MNNPLADDLDHILAQTEGMWDELRGKSIFITGGTGFFGCWLLESFIWANDRLGLKAKAVVLTRDPQAFQRKAFHLAKNPAIELYYGDVRSFVHPAGTFSHIFHAATESSSLLNHENPLAMLDTIVEGTRHTLEFSRLCGTSKFLYISSGAVYGRQPPELTHVSEDYPGSPDPTNPYSAYSEGKRVGELLCALYFKQFGLKIKIGRCFAFVGPYQPLNAHFAIGNFIRDAMHSDPIEVMGDGTPIRSYMYAADLVVWLWTILLRGTPGKAYNIGAEQEITIRDLAQTIANLYGCSIHVAREPSATPVERYVPSTQCARAELMLQQTINLSSAIQATVKWHRSMYLEG